MTRAVGAALVLALLSSSAVAAGDPVIGYWTDTNVIIADAEGEQVRELPDFRRFSFSGSLLAGDVQGKRAVGYDLGSGDRTFTIAHASNPVVAAARDVVAFLPTFRRDEYARSVWMRTARGQVRKVAQFRAPGVDGIRHGMGGDGAPLEVAFDDRGRYLAIVFGLEPLRSFDVWVVDTKTRAAARMTRGENSHNPSLSPGGEQLAVRVERPESCPDPVYGEILIGKIRVIERTTRTARDLTAFDCDLFYDTPRWIDDETLVAVRVTKDPEETYGYDLDLVRIDASSGEVTELLTAGNPCCITASPSLGKVAYGFSDRAGFAVLEVATGEVVEFDAGAYVPHLAGEGRS
ncbi:MAG TPA: hypothetical protein VEV43_03935 [Actinomycetota bacterium]|nr:hypothetical protein [Actinomycetota bacterium]